MRKAILFGLVGVLLSASVGWAVLGGGDFAMPAAGAKGVLFSHEFHVGKTKIGCAECHKAAVNREAIYYPSRANHKTATMEDMRKGKSCGVCHNGTRAFGVAQSQNCARCHNVEKK